MITKIFSSNRGSALAFTLMIMTLLLYMLSLFSSSINRQVRLLGTFQKSYTREYKEAEELEMLLTTLDINIISTNKLLINSTLLAIKTNYPSWTAARRTLPSLNTNCSSLNLSQLETGLLDCSLVADTINITNRLNEEIIIFIAGDLTLNTTLLLDNLTNVSITIITTGDIFINKLHAAGITNSKLLLHSEQGEITIKELSTNIAPCPTSPTNLSLTYQSKNQNLGCQVTPNQPLWPETMILGH